MFSYSDLVKTLPHGNIKAKAMYKNIMNKNRPSDSLLVNQQYVKLRKGV